jgi:serine/threonine protein phosphatase PrpC
MSKLSYPITIEEVLDTHGKFLIVNATCTGRRRTNEDEHDLWIYEDNTAQDRSPEMIVGIYDGHGGNYVAVKLKENLMRNIREQTTFETFDEQTSTQIFVQYQNELILSGYNGEAGSTAAVICCKKEDSLWTVKSANCGDTEVNIVDNDFKVNMISKNHDPGDVEEKQRITETAVRTGWARDGDTVVTTDRLGGSRIFGVLAVARAFGDLEFKEMVIPNPYFVSKTVEPGNFVLMACDGLREPKEMKDNTVISKIIKTEWEKQETAIVKMRNIVYDLVLTSLKYGSQDNISVSLMLLL